jgi:hypothetical protein
VLHLPSYHIRQDTLKPLHKRLETDFFNTKKSSQISKNCKLKAKKPMVFKLEKAGKEETSGFLFASTRRFQTRQRAGDDLGAFLSIHFGERVGVRSQRFCWRLST